MKTEWIKVQEMLPLPNLDLLLWDGNFRQRGYYRNTPHNGKAGNFFMIWEGRYTTARNPITHWMLLPEPPINEPHP